MRTIQCVLVILLALFFVGCPARSFFPLFADKDLVFDAKFLGTYTDPEKKGTATWERYGEKEYKVTLQETDEPGKPGKKSTYIVQMGRIGRYLFADSSPVDDFGEFHLLSTHLFSKVIFDGNNLAVSALESDRVRELIDKGALSISHLSRGNDIILTAPTGELQKLVLQLSADENAFAKPVQLGHK